MCLYLQNCAAYSADVEEYVDNLTVCFKIFRIRRAYPDALRVALKLNNAEFIDTIMEECKDPTLRKQMGFMIARQGAVYNARNEELAAIIGNQRLSEFYLLLAKDLQVLEPKTVDQILKTHLESTSKTLFAAPTVDSVKQNLSETYVSAFVNMGFGTDGLLTMNASSWPAKHKEGGKFASAACLGLIHLWQGDVGMNAIDRFLYVPDDNIVSGAYMALGIVNSGLRSEFDPALQILSEGLASPKPQLKLGAVLGLSFAYAGTNRQELLEALTPIVIDTNYTVELSAMSALCLGIVFLGSCNVDVLNTIMQGVTDRDTSTLDNNPMSRYFALALGLVFLGQQEKIDTILEAVKMVPPPLGKFMTSTLIACAYAGTGNVLKIQEMLHACGEHIEAKDALHQVAAVLGVATIAMGEEIGNEMAFRTMGHLLQYGEPIIRRTVPLAIGLLSLSNPQISTMDLLIKLTYDNDQEVALSAIFALGLIGAGTNNSRLAEALRQLAPYASKSSENLFLVRIAQGLLQMGKGLVSIQPSHSNRFLLSHIGLAGILTAVLSCTNMQNLIFGNHHYLLLYLALAANPRMCMMVRLRPTRSSTTSLNPSQSPSASDWPWMWWDRPGNRRRSRVLGTLTPRLPDSHLSCPPCRR